MPEFLQARIKGTIHGSQTINVLNFSTDEAPGTPDALITLLTALAQAIIECVIEFWIEASTQDWVLEGVDAKRLSPNPSDPIELAGPVGLSGSRQTVNCSFECVIMRIKTGLGGKRKRGRIFLPPPGDADITNSVLSAGGPNDFMTQFLACMKGKFIGPGATTAFRLGVLSQKTLKEQPGNYAAAFTPATQLNIEQRVSSLRSRKLGHGG